MARLMEGMRSCASAPRATRRSAKRPRWRPSSTGVSGIATILDDCTIQINGFDFDGSGINVQLYGGLAGDYARASR